jgi:hypothetical protein
MSDGKNSGAAILLFLLFGAGSVGVLTIDTTQIDQSNIFESTTTPNPTTPQETLNNMSLPALHVDGNKIKDANGNTVILRGVDDSITTWWDSGVGYDAAQMLYMKNWGCNAVRITISDWDLGFTTGNLGVYENAAFWTRLDSLVNDAIANGLYPIICGWATMGNYKWNGAAFVGAAYGETGAIMTMDVAQFMSDCHTWADYVEVYNRLAQRYTGKNVLYELYNEPLYCNLATYKAQNEAATDAIRTHDPNAIVIVQAVSSGDWIDQSLAFTQSYAINRSNIVYCVHTYSHQTHDTSQSAIRAKLTGSGNYNLYATECLAAGHPVIVTEFAGGGNGVDYVMHSWSESGVTAFSTAWLNNFMAVATADGYCGFTAWRWCTSAYDYACLLTNWSGNETTYGSVIKTYYLTHPLPPPSTSLSTPTIATPSFSGNPIEVNTPIVVNASVSGSSGTPTGTVTFYYSINNGSSWTQYSVKTLSGGNASSNPYYPTTAGTQLHKVIYSGDATYHSGSSSNAQLIVNATPPINPPPVQYFYTRIHNATGGTTSPSGNLTNLVGETVSILAIPNQNNTFWHWLINNTVTSTNLTLNITGVANTTYDVQPEFTANVIPTPTPTTWTLTSSTQGTGSMTPTSSTQTDLTIQLTATAGPGYVFDSFIIDGVSYSDNPHSFTSVFGASHTVVAVFTPASTPEPVVNQEASTLLDTTMARLQTATAPSFEDALVKLKEAGLI